MLFSDKDPDTVILAPCTFSYASAPVSQKENQPDIVVLY